MTARALLFDIGNTRVKWGVLDDGDLSRTGSITHEALKEKGIEALTRRLPKTVDRAIACNVAGPDIGRRFARAIGIHIGGDLGFVHSESRGYGVVSAYRQSRTLGVDRWVAMVAAREEFAGAMMVVDLGTAVTIDAVTADGTHLGGQIIPGLRLLRDALARDTSDIGAVAGKSVRIDGPRDFFATTTGKAVACGSLGAVCGAIERAEAMLLSLGHQPTIVLTGGDASRILPLLAGEPEHRPHLVLQGLGVMVQSDP